MTLIHLLQDYAEQPYIKTQNQHTAVVQLLLLCASTAGRTSSLVSELRSRMLRGSQKNQTKPNTKQNTATNGIVFPAPKLLCWSYNPKTWRYWEVGPLGGNQVLDEAKRVGQWWWDYKKRSELSFHHCEKAAVYKPTREPSPGTDSTRPESRASSLQNHEKVNFNCWNHFIYCILYGSSSN